MRPCFLPLRRRSQRCAQLEKNATFVLIYVQLLSLASLGKNTLLGFLEFRAVARCKTALPYADLARKQSIKAELGHPGYTSYFCIRHLPTAKAGSL
jgi:hypothetical protein